MYLCIVHYIPAENALKITCKCLSQAAFVSLQATNSFDKDFILIDIKYICVCVYSICQIYAYVCMCVYHI